MLKSIVRELKNHAPFTFAGALAGIVVAIVFVYARVPQHISEKLFWTFHPAHVFFSAMVTAAMYRRHGRGGLIATILIGYVGAVAIGTISDSLIPYLGELLLGIDGQAHIGFIDMWYLVNPLALLGIAVALLWPRTRFPHFGHVLLSTGASLFHMTWALGRDVTVWTMALIVVVLFVAVWVPCCTSDIVFPLLFAGKEGRHAHHGHCHG